MWDAMIEWLETFKEDEHACEKYACLYVHVRGCRYIR